MVIALQRMQKPGLENKIVKGSSGVVRYCRKSLEDREKVENYGGLADEVLG